MDGRVVTLLLADGAAALYAVAMVLWLLRRDTVARLAWTAGCAIFVTHVAFAFQFYHHWSHSEAYLATARQTADLFGPLWGWGLYLNYAFTLLWIVDTIWWWAGLENYRRRAGWIAVAVHSFLAFMFFNATVVFGRGWTRWIGAATAIAVAALYGISRMRTSITLVPVGPVLIRDSKASKK